MQSDAATAPVVITVPFLLSSLRKYFPKLDRAKNNSKRRLLSVAEIGRPLRAGG